MCQQMLPGKWQRRPVHLCQEIAEKAAVILNTLTKRKQGSIMGNGLLVE